MSAADSRNLPTVVLPLAEIRIVRATYGAAPRRRLVDLFKFTNRQMLVLACVMLVCEAILVATAVLA
jgi:hypothetical protein